MKLSNQRFDIGPVTAYADAVAGGYTGTRADFQKYMAKLVDGAIDIEGAAPAASAAAASEKAASGSASAAAASATTAETNGGIATTAATNAKASATAAQESQTAAKTSEEQASASATTATTAANTAESAATSAASSASSAAASAANAKTSETEASTSAGAAAQSATLAAAYKYDPNTYEGVDLTVKFAEEIKSYSSVWAWIQARTKAGKYTDIHVGDYIPFETNNGITLNAQIAGIDTYTGYGGTADVGHHIDFICVELWPTVHAFNKVDFNNGISSTSPSPWMVSDLYHYINSLSGTVPSKAVVGGGDGEAVDYTVDGIYYYLPAALKSVVIQKRVMVPHRYSASGLLSSDNGFYWALAGYLWLPTEWEVCGGTVWGSTGYGSGGSAVQYPLFAHGMRRAKKIRGDRNSWWLLSTGSGSSTSFAYVSLGGYVNIVSASNTYVAAPVCFRVG